MTELERAVDRLDLYENLCAKICSYLATLGQACRQAGVNDPRIEYFVLELSRLLMDSDLEMDPEVRAGMRHAVAAMDHVLIFGDE